MTIDEAIKIKTVYVEHLPPGVNEDWINADKMSIEALKRLLYTRQGYILEYTNLLPGETKE